MIGYKCWHYNQSFSFNTPPSPPLLPPPPISTIVMSAAMSRMERRYLFKVQIYFYYSHFKNQNETMGNNVQAGRHKIKMGFDV